MAPIEDHPLRYKLSNELHARPFPTLDVPCVGAYLAIKKAEDAASRDRDADWTHLIALLDRYGAPHPAAGATHYYGKVGRYWLKWESHTEFVTFTAFEDGLSERPFDPAEFEVFPEEWLDEAPGVRLTSALIRVVQEQEDAKIAEVLEDWFVSESLAVNWVLDKTAVTAADFRIDPAGHMRLAVFVQPDTGARRLGRIVQRLCEIETYKSMSMLGLARARDISKRMTEIDEELLRLVDDMSGGPSDAESTLTKLLSLSAELENMSAKAAFRFSATRAYEAIVTQRIDVLREERFLGRQTFSEFMMRRFDPAMRTVQATERRLRGMSDRALRAGDLLRTRVDVERQSQNQKLLESMDRRADLQLRLQKTVEGFSTVAITYYAVSLLMYLAAPTFGALPKALVGAALTVLVGGIVYLSVRRMRKALE
ncbi:DUF3422 family protein [Shimia ponticola]|uniref:DUF3422 family protein n=1 Tax=Shimia ponticola TaxID=2582893 RepID=UPI0011BEFFA1|nr:DUF3422 domain-containing protein [Shimia ponticola]